MKKFAKKVMSRRFLPRLNPKPLNNLGVTTILVLFIENKYEMKIVEVLIGVTHL